MFGKQLQLSIAGFCRGVPQLDVRRCLWRVLSNVRSGFASILGSAVRGIAGRQNVTRKASRGCSLETARNRQYQFGASGQFLLDGLQRSGTKS